MSKGKKWKTPKKYLHKRHRHKGDYKVGGNSGRRLTFRYFRHKKRFQCLMEGKVSMRKMVAMEIWFWDLY